MLELHGQLEGGTSLFIMGSHNAVSINKTYLVLKIAFIAGQDQYDSEILGPVSAQ